MEKWGGGRKEGESRVMMLWGYENGKLQPPVVDTCELCFAITDDAITSDSI